MPDRRSTTANTAKQQRRRANRKAEEATGAKVPDGQEDWRLPALTIDELIADRATRPRHLTSLRGSLKAYRTNGGTVATFKIAMCLEHLGPLDAISQVKRGETVLALDLFMLCREDFAEEEELPPDAMGLRRNHLTACVPRRRKRAEPFPYLHPQRDVEEMLTPSGEFDLKVRLVDLGCVLGGVVETQILRETEPQVTLVTSTDHASIISNAVAATRAWVGIIDVYEVSRSAVVPDAGDEDAACIRIA